MTSIGISLTKLSGAALARPYPRGIIEAMNQRTRALLATQYIRSRFQTARVVPWPMPHSDLMSEVAMTFGTEVALLKNTIDEAQNGPPDGVADGSFVDPEWTLLRHICAAATALDRLLLRVP